MKDIQITRGARGKLIDTLIRGGGKTWQTGIEYEYVGAIDACRTKLYIFRSISSGFETTVAARDFFTGAMQFTGSKTTQRERVRYNAPVKAADLSVSVNWNGYKINPPTGVTRI